MQLTQSQREELQRRLQAAVQIQGEHWIFHANTNSKSHPEISFRGKNISAHKASYIAFIGDIPEGMWVLHRCTVRGCIAPTCLYAGTPQSNAQDMRNAGNQHCQVLTWNDVLIIRQSNDTRKQLARRFGISDKTVGKIIRGEIWKGNPPDTTAVAYTQAGAATQVSKVS